MNIAMCLMGGFPMCHGAGGLAGQYRFGGRSGAAVIILGLMKVSLGLLFGQSCLELLRACTFPYSVLGVMLCVSGLELAMAGMAREAPIVAAADVAAGGAPARVADGEWERGFLLVTTAVATIGYSSTALGFLIGLMVYVLLLASERLELAAASANRGTKAALVQDGGLAPATRDGSIGPLSSL